MAGACLAAAKQRPIVTSKSGPADFLDCAGIADHFNVGDAVEQPDTLAFHRASEGRGEVFGAFHPLGPAAIGLGDLGEVGIAKVGGAYP